MIAQDEHAKMILAFQDWLLSCSDPYAGIPYVSKCYEPGPPSVRVHDDV